MGDLIEVVGRVIASATPSGSCMTGQFVSFDGGVTANQ